MKFFGGTQITQIEQICTDFFYLCNLNYSYSTQMTQISQIYADIKNLRKSALSASSACK
jgi:hypothetical protein